MRDRNVLAFIPRILARLEDHRFFRQLVPALGEYDLFPSLRQRCSAGLCTGKLGRGTDVRKSQLPEPCARTVALSSTFCNSRILPGQGCVRTLVRFAGRPMTSEADAAHPERQPRSPGMPTS